MSDLLPCPFCRQRPAGISGLHDVHVVCVCYAEGPASRSQGVSVYRWNVRPIEGALREERDTARAEADALRAEVATLKAAKPDPVRALLAYLDANDAEIEITRTDDDDDDNPATWMISYTICGSGSWAEGALDAAARKLCDRLGVSLD